MIILDILNPDSEEECHPNHKDEAPKEEAKFKDHKRSLRVQVININGQIVDIER